MSISGHKTEAVYRRYDIVSTSDLNLAKAKMEAYITEVRAHQNVASEEPPTKPPEKVN